MAQEYMSNKQYAELIQRGDFLYWEMLGRLRGIENHRDGGLRWLTGDIEYNYSADASDAERADEIIERMKSGELPKNLNFRINDLDADPSGPFKETGLFGDGFNFGMAHELLDTSLPKPDSRIDIYKVRERSQLKAAGAVLSAAFQYRLFTLGHFIEMMENDGQFFYLAEYNGLPAGACMSQHGDDFINISWVAVLPGHRKLGVAGYLIQAAERDGVRCGKKVGTLYGGLEAVGAYRRVGYREYCRGIQLFLT